MAAALSWNTLAIFSRALSTMLSSGVNIVKSFKVAGVQSLDRKLQRASETIVLKIRKGSTVSAAMRDQGTVFPTLVIDLVDVAEQTGSLPEVLSALADHYDNLVRLRKSFLSAIAWPVFQLIAAVLIVAGLLMVLGWIATMNKGQPVDILGLGLVGEKGAILWLCGCFGTAIAGYFIYLVLTTGLAGRTIVHTLLLHVPIIGTCMRNFAIARFSWAFSLTQQSGMSIEPSLEAGLKATGNGAFVATIPQMVAMVREGEDLTTSLMATGLYPRDYLELVRVGETTGTVPEQLERISHELEERARRSLSALTSAFAWMIWSLVAVMIIIIIVRFFSHYVSMINDMAKGI